MINILLLVTNNCKKIINEMYNNKKILEVIP